MHPEHRRQVLRPKCQEQVAESSEANKKQYQQVGARSSWLIHGLMITAVRGPVAPAVFAAGVSCRVEDNPVKERSGGPKEWSWSSVYKTNSPAARPPALRHLLRQLEARVGGGVEAGELTAQQLGKGRGGDHGGIIRGEAG